MQCSGVPIFAGIREASLPVLSMVFPFSLCKQTVSLLISGCLDNSVLVGSTVVPKLVREVKKIHGKFHFEAVPISLKVSAHSLVVKVLGRHMFGLLRILYV